MTSKEAINDLLNCDEDMGNYEKQRLEIIKKDLGDLEWLKSKLNLTFLDSLPDYRDRLKVMEIMGFKYTKEIK